MNDFTGIVHLISVIAFICIFLLPTLYAAHRDSSINLQRLDRKVKEILTDRGYAYKMNEGTYSITRQGIQYNVRLVPIPERPYARMCISSGFQIDGTDKISEDGLLAFSCLLNDSADITNARVYDGGIRLFRHADIRNSDDFMKEFLVVTDDFVRVVDLCNSNIAKAQNYWPRRGDVNPAPQIGFH